jgi:hypothetical protein
MKSGGRPSSGSGSAMVELETALASPRATPRENPRANRSVPCASHPTIPRNSAAARPSWASTARSAPAALSRIGTASRTPVTEQVRLRASPTRPWSPPAGASSRDPCQRLPMQPRPSRPPVRLPSQQPAAAVQNGEIVVAVRQSERSRAWASAAGHGPAPPADALRTRPLIDQSFVPCPRSTRPILR